MTSEPGARERVTTCWCGGALGPAINRHYRRCLACGGVVLGEQPEPRHFDVADDARDFYGRAYWTEYADARGFPAIAERARSDLSERCVFWLERLIEVTHPPGRALEIGCGHGGFVRLLQELGFEAMGTELSPWVVDFAKRAFGVSVFLGRLEELTLQPGFKCIAAFDVLEHLKDPLDTVRRCADLLAPDGVLLLQTPCYRGEGPEWSMFQEDEHIHLFTEESVRLLLARAGFKDMRVERSLFPYDMWIVATLSSLPPPNLSAGTEGDWRVPAAFRSLLDISADVRNIRETLRKTAADSEERLAQVNEVTGLLQEAEADRAARHEQVQDLSRLLQELEGDRASRLAQIEKLTDWLHEAEADRAARGDVIEALNAGNEALKVGNEALKAGNEALKAGNEALEAQIEALKARIEAIEQTWGWRLYRSVASRVNRRQSP
jgi:SAM-dependent methyltransferase